MRFTRATLALLLLAVSGRLAADEHKYAAYVAGDYEKSKPSKGVHLAYEDTTKRTPLSRFPRPKHPWALFGEFGATARGPENRYLYLVGGRGSLGVKDQPLAFSGQVSFGYRAIHGSKQRIHAENLVKQEEALHGGGVAAAGVVIDYHPFESKQVSGANYKRIEDGPRAQVDLLYQFTGTKRKDVRVSLGWVIRYN
jgi:hypothetical protein